MPTEKKKQIRIRDMLIYSAFKHEGLSRKELAYAFTISYNRVYQIINYLDRCFRIHRKRYEES